MAKIKEKSSYSIIQRDRPLKDWCFHFSFFYLINNSIAYTIALVLACLVCNTGCGVTNVHKWNINTMYFSISNGHWYGVNCRGVCSTLKSSRPSFRLEKKFFQIQLKQQKKSAHKHTYISLLYSNNYRRNVIASITVIRSRVCNASFTSILTFRYFCAIEMALRLFWFVSISSMQMVCFVFVLFSIATAINFAFSSSYQLIGIFI